MSDTGGRGTDPCVEGRDITDAVARRCHKAERPTSVVLDPETASMVGPDTWEDLLRKLERVCLSLVEDGQEVLFVARDPRTGDDHGFTAADTGGWNFQVRLDPSVRLDTGRGAPGEHWGSGPTVFTPDTATTPVYYYDGHGPAEQVGAVVEVFPHGSHSSHSSRPNDHDGVGGVEPGLYVAPAHQRATLDSLQPIATADLDDDVDDEDGFCRGARLLMLTARIPYHTTIPHHATMPHPWPATTGRTP